MRSLLEITGSARKVVLVRELLALVTGGLRAELVDLSTAWGSVALTGLGGLADGFLERLSPMSVFKRRRFPAEIILLCVRWYCRYGISYRDLEEMMAERGVVCRLFDALPVGSALCAGARETGPLVPGLPIVVLAR